MSTLQWGNLVSAPQCFRRQIFDVLCNFLINLFEFNNMLYLIGKPRYPGGGHILGRVSRIRGNRILIWWWGSKSLQKIGYHVRTAPYRFFFHFQLEILRRAGAMPISSRRCGMITKREAERLCKSFLGDNSPPKLPENFAFEVRT